MSWIPPYFIDRALEVLGEFAEWTPLDPPELIDKIAFQFWAPQPDGTVGLARHDHLSHTEEDVKRCTQFCKTRNISTYLCVYNYNGRWDWELAHNAYANHTDRFINSLIAEMERYNLDGIDIDFEGHGDRSADRPAFAKFLRQLSAELRKRNKKLTVCIYHNPNLHAPNLSWIEDWHDEVDSVQSMGYDQLYGGAEFPYRYIDQQAIGKEHGLPTHKMLLGFPGWISSWGKGGIGTHLHDHLRELLELPQATGICIWDAAFIGEAWRTPKTIELLAQIKERNHKAKANPA